MIKRRKNQEEKKKEEKNLKDLKLGDVCLIQRYFMESMERGIVYVNRF